MGHSNRVDLAAAARQEMLEHGFHPDFTAPIIAQVAEVKSHGNPLHLPLTAGVRDLRELPWSSIDNDTSRDLDQIEYAERLPNGGARILIGIADVDSLVEKGTPVDLHAESEATSVYTGIETFPMLPEDLSTDLTSLLENADRLSLVTEVVIGQEGTVQSGNSYPALVRNQAQLTYSKVGTWLEGTCEPPAKVARSKVLQEQLRLQDEIARELRSTRYRMGALNIDTIETSPVLTDGQVTGITVAHRNRATGLIEDFMIAANEVVARTFLNKGVTSIRRVVKTPKRWDRIVEVAAELGDKLPSEPDSKALNDFLIKRRAVDPVHSVDLSTAIVKLLGPGEYVVQRPDETEQGHFGLAVRDYSHSTAPNRRYADLVTQRLMKAMLAGHPSPYDSSDLEAIARNCTLKEDAARKVERKMRKRIAAVALSSRIGDTFRAVVTGVTPDGTFARIMVPPADGRIVRGEKGLDVGQQIQVKLLATDPGLGYIDFGALR